MEDNKHFRYTVIIPVYNTEDYLDETIGSILDQTIGFEDNIQLILVDDGSRDGSADICRKYRDRYPDNIEFIAKENGGVSSARNAALDHVRGEYVNFIDSDDKWGKDALELFDAFFREHPDVGIASAMMLLFGRKRATGYHLDYEYEQTRVIDISETYDYPLLSVSRAFIRTDYIGSRRFDEKLSVSEDMLFLNSIILEQRRYGLIREAIYYYRKREDETSALDRSFTNKSFYIDTPKRAFTALVELSLEKYETVIPYIQYLLITDLQWRLRKPIPEGVLTEEERSGYLALMKDILSHIEDKYIVEQRHMKLWEKIAALRVKHGEAGYSSLRDVHAMLADDHRFMANILRSDGDELLIVGNAEEKRISDKYRIYAADEKGHRYEFEYRPYPQYDKTGMYEDVTVRGYIHAIRLPMRDGAEYIFYLQMGDEGTASVKKLKLRYGRNARVSAVKGSYFVTGKHIVEKRRMSLRVHAYSENAQKQLEEEFSENISAEGGSSAAALRAEFLRHGHPAKDIWIISDADDRPGAGAELFRYVSSKHKKTVEAYYLADRDSAAYEEMKKYGKVLAYGSREHYMRQLAAKKIITTDTGDDRYNPFGEDLKYYQGLIEYDSVLLWEGQADDEELTLMHYLRKDYSLIAVRSDADSRLFTGGRLGYDSSAVLVCPDGSGSQRFDYRAIFSRLADKKLFWLKMWR